MINKMLLTKLMVLTFCFRCNKKVEKEDTLFCDGCKTPKRLDCPYCETNHHHYWHFCKGKDKLYKDVKIVSIDDL